MINYKYGSKTQQHTHWTNHKYEQQVILKKRKETTLEPVC